VSILFIDPPDALSIGLVCEDYQKQLAGTVDRLYADIFFHIDLIIQKMEVTRIVTYGAASTKGKECLAIVQLLCQIYKIEYEAMHVNSVPKYLYGTMHVDFNSSVIDDFGHIKTRKLGRALALQEAWNIKEGLQPRTKGL